jgi:hypothetical protein
MLIAEVIRRRIDATEKRPTVPTKRTRRGPGIAGVG